MDGRQLIGRTFKLKQWQIRLRCSASSRLELWLEPPESRLQQRRRGPNASQRSLRSFRMNETGDSSIDDSSHASKEGELLDIKVYEGGHARHSLRQHLQTFGEGHDRLHPPPPPTHSSSTHSSTSPNVLSSFYSFKSFPDGHSYSIRHSLQPHQPGSVDWTSLPEEFRQTFQTPQQIAHSEIQSTSTVEPTLDLDELSPELRQVFETEEQEDSSLNDSACDPPSSPSRRSIRRLQRIAEKKHIRKASREQARQARFCSDSLPPSPGMSPTTSADSTSASVPATHKPLAVRTKPKSTSISSMEPTDPPTKAEVNKEIEKNLSNNTAAAAPAEDAAPPTKKKEKGPKAPKPPKAAPAAAPLSPALIDLRVGHILRAINHPNADSLYVSTIAMGDPEGTEHTQVDEETGKVVRTVCSGLNGLVPLAEMQDRKVIVVANLKPVNMRSIKSAAMVLAASPPAPPDADPHAADRVVELVIPPEGAEAGDAVYFEGWEYGEGKGPEKQLNPKKKQWEAIQPGFFTSEELVVGFDAGKSEVEGEKKGMLVVEGKGKCTVKTLKGAVVR
jgi:tRNA-binding EMAP/Myf-like protein